jgi:metallo-beta-lactamase class B
VFADSLNPVSSDGFRFSDAPARVAAFQASVEAVGQLNCDVLIPVHPGFSRLLQQAERAEVRGTRALVDPRACRRYAADARRRLEARREAEGG